MILITSLNPSPASLSFQTAAVASWQKLGLIVYALNRKSEILSLKSHFPYVNFIITDETTEARFSRPHVRINALLDFAASLPPDVFCFINSDIIMENNRQKLSIMRSCASEALIYASRYNFKASCLDATRELYGIDVFMMPSSFLSDFSRTFLSMGQCYWDYWVPFTALVRERPLYKLEEPFFFHQWHPLRWNMDQWNVCAEEFRRDPNFSDLSFPQDNQEMGRHVRKAFDEVAISLNFDSRLIHPILQELYVSHAPVIFEIGTHLGEDTVKLSKLASHVYTFEADPRNRPRNLPQNVTFTPHAISDHKGTAPLTLSDKYGAMTWTESSSIKRPKNHLSKYPGVSFTKTVSVPCTSLDIYCQENSIQPEFIWADIQGAEEEMIKGGLVTLLKAKYLYTEYSNEELYEGQITLDQILLLLPSYKVLHIWEDNVLLQNTAVTS